MSYFMDTVGTKGVGKSAESIAAELKQLMDDTDAQITRGYTDGLIGVMSTKLQGVADEVLVGMHRIDKQLASGGAAIGQAAAKTEEAAQQVSNTITKA